MRINAIPWILFSVFVFLFGSLWSQDTLKIKWSDIVSFGKTISYVTSITVEPNGRVWYGREYAGVSIAELVNGKITIDTTFDKNWGGTWTYSPQFVHYCNPTTVLIASGGLLSTINPKTYELKKITKTGKPENLRNIENGVQVGDTVYAIGSQYDPYSSPTYRLEGIYKIFEDKIITIKKGLPFFYNDIYKEIDRAIAVDSEKRVWFGGRLGLSRYDIRDSTLWHSSNFYKWLIGHYVKTIIFDPSTNNLFVITTPDPDPAIVDHGGFSIINLTTEEVKKFDADSVSIPGIDNLLVLDQPEDMDILHKYIVIGGGSRYVLFYNISKNEFYVTEIPNNSPFYWVERVKADPWNNRIWLALGGKDEEVGIACIEVIDETGMPPPSPIVTSYDIDTTKVSGGEGTPEAKFRIEMRFKLQLQKDYLSIEYEFKDVLKDSVFSQVLHPSKLSTTRDISIVREDTLPVYYKIKFRAVDTGSGLKSEWSSEFEVKIEKPSEPPEPPPASVLPDKFKLYQNYPNPFNSETVIKYDIPGNAEEKSFKVEIVIYNLLGQHVRKLVDEIKEPGSYETKWDAEDSYGNPVSAGIYFYRLKTNEFTKTKKMLLIR